MKLKPSDLPTVDITDLIAVICKLRAERYKFERHVALRTFSAWMLWPMEPRIVDQAKIVSAGRVIRMILAGDLHIESTEKRKCLANIVNEAMPLESLSEILMDPPLKTRFCVAAEESFGTADVYQMIGFFLSCPIELRPSLNKAIHFQEMGGFQLGASSATTRAAWVRYLIAGPFSFVEFPAIDFQPDDPRRTTESINLLRDVNKLKGYFGAARYVQERLLERLDPATKNRFKFLEFPSEIDVQPVDITPYSAREIELIKAYRAPKVS
jgi:hypothetical protein